MKKYLYIATIFLALGALAVSNAQVALSAGGGTITQLDVFTIDGSGNITQRVASTPFKLSGIADGCANFTSGVLGSTGSACGSGGGGGSVGNWFTPTTNFGATANSTSTPIWFTAGLEASTTSNFLGGLTVDSGTAQTAVTVNGHSTSVGSTFTIADVTTAGNTLGDLINPSGTGNSTLANVPLSGTIQTGSGATGGLILFNKANAPIIFGTGGNAFTNERLRITGTGNVGVSTTSPYALFSVGGNVVVGASTAGGTLGDLFLPKLGTAAGSFLAVDPTGKVIGTTTPVGGGSSTSIGTVATSTQETQGQVAVWGTTNGYPAKLFSQSTSTPTVTAPITYSGTLGSFVGGASGAFGCTSASSGVTGCLSGTDWNTFNGKENVLTFTTPLMRTSNTIVFVGLATTSQPSSSNLLTSNGAAGVYGTATSTLTASGPLTGSFTQVGSGGSLGCTTASAGVAGCLNSSDWSTFNNKQATLSATWPEILTSATLSFGWATTSQPASSNLFVSNGSNGFYGVATGTVSAGSSAITVTGGRAAIGGALAIDCATAGSGQNGCLSSTDWNTFNNKDSFVWPFTPTTFGSGVNAEATSSVLYPAGLVTGTSTIGALVASSSITNQAVKSALVLDSATGLEGVYGGSSNPCAANQAPTTLSAVGALGGCTSTFLTGNQTVTLSGAVTGSGATAITTAFGTMSQGILANIASAAAVPSPVATSSLYANNTVGGDVLTVLNGVPIFTATSTDSCSSGVTCSFSGTTESFSIGNGAITNAMLATTYVQTLTVSTAQGVSGSFSAGATPALSLTLGALTGVTSFNGLVVTANTGVITTGTWNGTTIAVANGGTNQTSFSTNGVAYFDGTRLNTDPGLFEWLNGPGQLLVGTTTEDIRSVLTLASSTAPELTIGDGLGGDNLFSFNTIGGNFFLATSSPNTFATSTNAWFSMLTAGGFSTTTFKSTDFTVQNSSANAFNVLDLFGTQDLTVNTASTTGSIFTVAATTSPNLFAGVVKLFDVDQYGHLTASSTRATPTITCSPSGGTMDANSNDDVGGFTTGTLSTSCTITFASAYAIAPKVFVQTGATASGVLGVTSISTTAFTVSISTAVTADDIDYFVLQP